MKAQEELVVNLRHHVRKGQKDEKSREHSVTSSNPNSFHLSVKRTGVLTSLLSFVRCSSEFLAR